MIHSILSGTSYLATGAATCVAIGSAGLVSSLSATITGELIISSFYPEATESDATCTTNLGRALKCDPYHNSPTWKKVAILALLGLSGALVGSLTGGSIMFLLAAKYSFIHLASGVGMTATVGACVSMLHDPNFFSTIKGLFLKTVGGWA